MEIGLNFKNEKNQKDYYRAYEKSLQLFQIPVTETYIKTFFGETHVLCYGDKSKPSLLLLHAASCGSTIWYPNFEDLGNDFQIYAIDLITESSKSILKRKIKNNQEIAAWLDETVTGLGLTDFYMGGLSIGGWTAANYAGYYPDKIKKLILLSPVQTFARMYNSYFLKIMKMGFHPTRENVENYIGWGNTKESKLPESIIEQFTISVMNMNSNACFPKWLKKEHLHRIKMPVLVLFGENEFAFSVTKACKRAKRELCNAEIEVVEDASHLISVSAPAYINARIKDFIKK